MVPHLQSLKSQLERQTTPDGKFHPALVAEATALEMAYKGLIEARRILRKIGRPVDDLDEVILRNFPVHSDYTDPTKRWHAHALHVYDLVRSVMQTATRSFELSPKGGAATGPLMTVVCNALDSIDGNPLERDNEAVRKYIYLNRECKPKDRWRHFWNVKKFPERWEK